MRLSCLLLVLAACGVTDAKPLTDLDVADLQALCEEFPERDLTCGEGDAEPVRFGGDCAAVGEAGIPTGCSLTAGDYRACYAQIQDASEEDLCEGVPTICSPLFTAECAD